MTSKYNMLFSVIFVTILLCKPLLFNEIFAISPSFIRQEIIDGDDDWFLPPPVFENYMPEDTIRNITGSVIGNILSVSYVSDGKTLNATFWLSSPFNKKLPAHHIISYYMYIDADFNTKTGLSGIDYIKSLFWDYYTQSWKTSFEEVSSSGERRSLEMNNYTGFDKYRNDTNYLLLSTDLGAMNYPSAYRLIFAIEDKILPAGKHGVASVITRHLTDFTNTVHIPPLQYTIYTSPASANITQGDKKTFRVGLQPSKSIESLGYSEPQVNFYNSDQTDGIKVNFSPNRTIIPFIGTAASGLTITVPKNVTADVHTLRIFANVSFPSLNIAISQLPQLPTEPFSTFGNPTQNATTNSNLTITVKEPIPIYEQFRGWISDWFTPLSGIPITIVSLITGILGWGIGNKLKKNKNKKVNDWSNWE